MYSIRHARRGTSLAAFLATLLLGATGSTPALAAAKTPQRSALIHQTPQVPIVVDGVRYAPEDIHRFDGRPLYTRISHDGESLIGFTKLARFEAYLRRQGVRLPAPADATTPKSRASGAGQWTKLCADSNELGGCFTITSGWGVANMDTSIGCNLHGGCAKFSNTIEWARSYGKGAVLFNWVNFNPAGGSIYLNSDEATNLAAYGWANMVESLYQAG